MMMMITMAAFSLLLLIICLCVSSQQFEQRGLRLANASSTSLGLVWDVDLYDENTMYKVWYWPVNTSSAEVSVIAVTDGNHVELDDLVPGQMYTVWLFGMMEGNITSDYVTFQHRTGLWAYPINLLITRVIFNVMVQYVSISNDCLTV